MMCQNGCFQSRHLPRVFLSALFIVGGLGFLMGFSQTVGYVAMGLAPLGLAGMATVATIVAIILKLGGGLMLLLNYRTSTAAWMLIAFTVGATLLYHTDWTGDGGTMQMTQFLKNLAIIGGLSLFAGCPCPTCKNNCKNHEEGTHQAATPTA